MRSFVAIELEPTLRGKIARFIRQRFPRTSDARWSSEDQLHVTLKFLGEVQDAHLPRVCEVLSETARQLRPFDLTIGGLGCVPSRGSPRVLWMGVEDPGRNCADWLALADAKLIDLGFDPERRAFTPHVTLGRAKNRAGGAHVARLVETLEGPPPMTMRVESLTLFESRLSPSGAQYVPMMKVPLSVS